MDERSSIEALLVPRKDQSADLVALADNLTPEFYRVKLLSMGATEVGKSCLIKYFCEDRFFAPYVRTIGVDYGVKVVDLSAPKRTVYINLWDLSGLDEFAEVRKNVYADTSLVFAVFDVTQRSTFEKLKQLLLEAKQNGLPSKVPGILIGNKCDLVGTAKYTREIDDATAKRFAIDHGWEYLATSAKTGTGLKETVLQLVSNLVQL